MNSCSRGHLSDQALLRDLAHHIGQERSAMAVVVADIAEVDERKLYLPAGYPSMFAYCVGELGLSEDAAYKRIQAGRAARQFPAIFEALADGRLHLTAVNLLAPHLNAGNVDELLQVAEHKRKADIEQMLAERFPRSEVPALLAAIPGVQMPSQLAPAQVGNGGELAPKPVGATGAAGELAPAQVGGATLRSKVAPIAPAQYAVQFCIGQQDHDLLEYAQALLSHQVPSGDVAEVFVRALRALVPQLEKRKFAATDRPRRSGRPSTSARHIPAAVRRAVWERDAGRCTFVGDKGHRCEARRRLEFDHVCPVARGGRATLDNLRLRCRAHNQYAAGQVLGAAFMRGKIQEARQERARAAAERCAAMANASLEDRVKAALSYLAPRAAFQRRAAPA